MVELPIARANSPTIFSDATTTAFGGGNPQWDPNAPGPKAPWTFDLDDEGFTDPFGNQVTRGEFLNLMAFHQCYHAGQLGLSRRLAGLPGNR